MALNGLVSRHKSYQKLLINHDGKVFIMAIKKPKSKGDAFQRKIAKFLSEKLAPRIFISTSQSGGRVGGSNYGKVGHKFGAAELSLYAGDIACSNESETGGFPYTVECKHYKTQPFLGTVLEGKGDIPGWYAQSKTDAHKCGKYPMLIMHWNHAPTYVMIPASCLRPSDLGGNFGMVGRIPKVGNVWIIELSQLPIDKLKGVIKIE